MLSDNVCKVTAFWRHSASFASEIIDNVPVQVDYGLTRSDFAPTAGVGKSQRIKSIIR